MMIFSQQLKFRMGDNELHPLYIVIILNIVVPIFYRLIQIVQRRLEVMDMIVQCLVLICSPYRS